MQRWQPKLGHILGNQIRQGLNGGGIVNLESRILGSVISIIKCGIIGIRIVRINLCSIS